MRRILVAVALIAAFAWAPQAFADATPIELVLLYTPKVSNTDTTSATGTAELVLEEGEVRVNTANLPSLDGDSKYVVWVINSKTNEFLKLGAFNTDPDKGTAHYENVMPEAIPNKNWDLLLLTVEKNADVDKPGAKHSLAATFPVAGDQAPPQLLPNTGGLPDDAVVVPAKSIWPSAPVLAALSGALGLGAGYALGLKRR